ARQVLSVFASYVSEGMIPNCFNDYTNEPQYNTVDASLWFVHACYEYARLSRDGHTFETTFLPACRAILEGYRKGTRFHIGMDEQQQRAVVEVVRRELLTPYGLRTLARSDPRYHGHYHGPPQQRDEAYHNGTVWPWPIGAFLDAYIKVHHHTHEAKAQARKWL